MECCAQIQKCNIDNKAFNEAKNKYAANHSKTSKPEPQEDAEGLIQENVWLNQKMQELQIELRRKTKQLHDLKKKMKG